MAADLILHDARVHAVDRHTATATAVPRPAQSAALHWCATGCVMHYHHHDQACRSNVPVSDFVGFWGALGCSCWAI